MSTIEETSGRTRKGWARGGMVALTMSALAMAGGTPAFADATPAEPATESVDVASPDDGDPAGRVDVQSSKRFTVTNLSQYKMKLASVSGDQKFEGRPDTGTEMRPGTEQNFEVTYVYRSTQRNYLDYDVFDASDTRIGGFSVALNLKSGGISDSLTSDCGVTGWKGTCQKGGSSVVVIDQAGTNTTIPATDPARQGQVLDQLCDQHSGQVSCEFKRKSSEVVTREPRAIGDAIWNGASGPITIEASADGARLSLPRPAR